MKSSARGFTLIELLIVVAIIAILAAIAVPNFLEAQTRAKVSRMQTDMRSVATAIEAYHVDNNRYPLAGVDSPYGDSFTPDMLRHTIYAQLSTPISYISSFPLDVFVAQDYTGPDDTRKYIDYRRTFYRTLPSGERTIDDVGTGSLFPNNPDVTPTSWMLMSAGPDKEYNLTTHLSNGQPVGGFNDPLATWCIYDPTNGTISAGDIVRSREASDGAQLLNF